jgi:hemerythrin
MRAMEVQMELFTWCDYYSVNNDELDNHHKALFDIFNRLHEDCLGHDNAKCIIAILEELVLYAQCHFIAEERYMRNIGYKEIDKHIIEHTEFAQKILQLRQVAVKDDIVATEELVLYLGEWILNHVFDEDKKYAIC